MPLKEFLKFIYPLVLFFSSLRTLHVSRKKVLLISLRLLFVILLITGLTAGSYWYIFQNLPSPGDLTSQAIPQSTHILDRNGKELYKIYKSQNRTLLKLNDIPLQMRQAILSIEDKDFYYHRGFSPTGTIRAAVHTLTGERLEGGSTITQQLVKTSLLTQERTIQRKLRELVLSIAVETLYTKDEILEMYLNRVGFGGAAYGVEEASQTYFQKSIQELNLSEISLLAGLPASPTVYSPFGIHPELAKNRQKEVLRRMVSDGYITWEEAESASAAELVFSPPETNIKAPHFVMYIKELLAEKYGTELLEQGGLEVITSLDLEIQETAEKIVREETAKVAHLNITNGAALVTVPQTGEILAMVGSRNYFDLTQDGNVNVTLSPRQPGSSIKPINYALALSSGFTAASIIDDSPITYHTPGQPSYSPVNYDNKFHGRVTLRSALANSFNVPAVKILSANGVNNMIELGQKMGISTWEDKSRFGLSLTLGGGEVTMTDMAVAYGTFANQGSRVDLHPILTVRDSKGRLLEEFRCSDSAVEFIPSVQAANNVSAFATEVTFCPPKEVLSPAVAFLISDILADNSARTLTFGPNSQLNIPKSVVAVKTGTTNNLRDNWTLGYTPNIFAAAWVGNNNNTPMSYVASGVTGASPIWRRIMDELLNHFPSPGFTPPPGLVKIEICRLTGQLACPTCPSSFEYFIEGTQPKNSCSPGQIESIIKPKSKSTKDADRILHGSSTFRP